MKYVKRAKSVKKKQASVPKSAESEGTALYNRDSDASTGSDNDLGVMDNSMIVDSDSEKGVQVENYDTEFEQDTYVSFVPRKFADFQMHVKQSTVKPRYNEPIGVGDLTLYPKFGKNTERVCYVQGFIH